ncbi:hypothetical protein Holit_03004 [Hollandina sp. SP2]
MRVRAKDKEGLGEGSKVHRHGTVSSGGKEVLVMDNLNTHTLSSWYEPYPAEEAFGIARKVEIHYTPKHGA